MEVGVSASVAWLASVREDVTLLANVYLPELLLISFLLLLVLLIRKQFGGARSSF